MRSSDRKINDKLKAVIAAVLFIAVVIVFSVVVFLPYKKVWSKTNHYDTLFLGASRVYKGIRPVLMDEHLGCNSYDLSSDSLSIADRYVLLESALEQGTLKTVVIEISFDALTDIYEYQEEGYVYEIEPMSKLEGLKRKLDFCNEKFNFWKDNYDNVYPTLMSYGFERWEKNIRGRQEEKGFVHFGSIPKGFSADEAAEIHDSFQVNSDYKADKKELVNKMIETCLENDIRVVIINTPDTEANMWRYTGWEVFEDYMKDVSARYGVEMYDFNLYKGRQDIFDDNVHFNDYSHMCEDGADVFSPLLASVMKMGETGDTSDLFYDSYEEAKKHLTYAQNID